MLSWFEQEFAGWSELWHSLFLQADSFVIRPQFYFPAGEAWTSLNDLTMIGDAAHVVPPYAGEGVNMALLDALELAQTLTEETTRVSGNVFATFEASMRKRALATTAVTLEFTQAFHSQRSVPDIIAVIESHIAEALPLNHGQDSLEQPDHGCRLEVITPQS